MGKKDYDPAMHTAEHILNQTMDRMFACGRSFNAHIEKKKSKCDYRFPRPLTAEEIAAVEAAVNRVIGQNLPVSERMVDAGRGGGALFHRQAAGRCRGNDPRSSRSATTTPAPASAGTSAQPPKFPGSGSFPPVTRTACCASGSRCGLNRPRKGKGDQGSGGLGNKGSRSRVQGSGFRRWRHPTTSRSTVKSSKRMVI